MVLVVVISGCGAGETKRVPASSLAEAARATEQLPGSSISVETNFAIPGTRRRIIVKLRGVQNGRQRAAHLVGTYEKLPHVFLGAGGGIRVEGITIRSKVFVRSPLFYDALPARKQWIALDLARADRPPGVGDPTQLAAGPTQSLRALRTVRSRVEQVSSEDVRGVPTTHYRATLDRDSLPVEVWIDRRRLIRRIRTRMTMSAEGRQVAADVTTELFDFGSKPRIAPPPADQTIDGSAISGAGAGP